MEALSTKIWRVTERDGLTLIVCTVDGAEHVVTVVASLASEGDTQIASHICVAHNALLGLSEADRLEMARASIGIHELVEKARGV